MKPNSIFGELKVLDFSWAGVGPLVSKYLADFGATVVKVESMSRPDTIRIASPYKDNIAGANRSGLFLWYNSNKYSVSMNLNHRKALKVVTGLVNWCDIVVESFTPGTMEKFGLGFEELRKMKPDIIMLRTCMEGQSGPRAGRRLLGSQGVGLVGFTYLTGFPGDDPVQPFGAYTDYTSPRLGIAAVIAALDYRRRSGKGQCLDLAQYEAGLQFLLPQLLDYTGNARIAERAGNACDCAAPHAAYRCQGDDRWCAIAVLTDEEWQSFCGVIDRPELKNDDRFATVLARKANEKELDRLIEEWTVLRPAEEVMRKLQTAGVPAAVVRNTADVYDDPHTWEDGHMWLLEHGEIGPAPHLGQSARFSETPATPRMPAPLLGQHTEYVMTELLGMKTDEFVELLNAGVFE